LREILASKRRFCILVSELAAVQPQQNRSEPSGEQTTPATQEGARRGRGPGGDSSPQVEHKFEVLFLDRKTGKVLWQKTAKTAVPHEGYHRAYGSFASNSPVTDGKYPYVSFGSRGVYCFDFNGRLILVRALPFGLYGVTL